MLVQRPLAAVSNTKGRSPLAWLCTGENRALSGCLVSSRSLCSVTFPQPILAWDQG